jgi:serine/threonine-protein kinase
MGEVYRARDTLLERDVAIKVLPDLFASDAERLARFRREAQTLASLNHPNIAIIHGLEQSGEVHALVMELVSGEDLSQRIARGPIPIDEALLIAKQIADALEAAHEQGIIHRDLKPANIKLRPDGTVKVLDFGLAKAFDVAPSASDASQSPTITSPAMTHMGVILGTAAYMSPEQTRGQAVDKRSDIWAFGCVLYEILTARTAFAGDTISDTIAAILGRGPDWQTLPATTPDSIRRLLRRCFEKDPKRRLHDIADARIEIEEVLHQTDASWQAAPLPTAPAAGMGALGRRPLPLSLGTLLLGAGIAGVAIWFLRPASSVGPQPVSRFAITLPPGDQLGPGRPVALSPDGSQLAYLAIRGSARQLYLRAMGSLETKAIPGTEGALDPFFSPDGQWIGFFAGGKMKKVSVNGGAALSLADAGDPLGASWGSQGTIVFAPTPFSVLVQVPSEGGGPQPLTQIAKGESSHHHPEFLPGGHAVLFAATDPGSARVAVQLIETGERRDLIQAAISPRYASSGHLLYAQGQTLMAVPFDPQRLEIKGAAVPAVEGVAGADQYSISATGSLVYVPGDVQRTQRRLVWVSRNGAEQTLVAPAREYDTPRLAPDGKRVAVEIGPQIWLYDPSRDTLTRLTFEGDLNNSPEWAPDGTRVAFYSTRDGPQKMFWQLADGSGGLERLTSGESGPQTPKSWSADGQLLAFQDISPTMQRDIWVLRLSDRKTEPFLRTPFIEGAPAFSPDARWLAYVSNESGRPEIYVQPYPGPGGKWQISTDGGTEPVWSRNGREVFYRSGNKMMAVATTTQPRFSAGKPQVLFEGEYFMKRFPVMGPAFDVSPDGQRFLMVKETDQAPSLTQINVVLNWFEELKRRVPTK